MIKFERTEVFGFEHAIRGMRNPLDSHKRSDSVFPYYVCDEVIEDCNEKCPLHREYDDHDDKCDFIGCNLAFIGPNDHKLMMNLRNSGTDHRKYLRMIVVYVDITAPLYFWKEFDQYKVGTVTNSYSTMHKIHAKKFTLDDFSIDHLYSDELEFFKEIIEHLNGCRTLYLQSKNDESARVRKNDWWQMIQLLPSSYNQKRTVMLNYEVLANIYKSRRNHKLDEWSIGFINWIKSLPYSELITGSKVINAAQNALKGPKFAARATFEENEGICKGEDKNPADALFDVIRGLNVSWFKNDEDFPEHYKKSISKLNGNFKDKNDGKK